MTGTRLKVAMFRLGIGCMGFVTGRAIQEGDWLIVALIAPGLAFYLFVPDDRG